MKQYIDKAALIAEIKKKIKDIYAGREYVGIPSWEEREIDGLKKAIEILDTLEVEEIEPPVIPKIPKHSYFEHIYHCGSEPMWKIGDVLAVYDFYSDYEGEHIYGKITDVKMDENEDWCYTFDNGDILYENMLISDEAYKKN